jgi:hypothetical protein
MNAAIARLSLAAVLAILAGPALAEDAQPYQLADPPGLDERLPADGQGTFDVAARLRGTRDGLSLEVGGARLEFRVAGDEPPAGEPFGGSAPGAHDFRASFSVDGKVTNLLFRFVPPPASEPGPPAK